MDGTRVTLSPHVNNATTFRGKRGGTLARKLRAYSATLHYYCVLHSWCHAQKGSSNVYVLKDQSRRKRGKQCARSVAGGFTVSSIQQHYTVILSTDHLVSSISSLCAWNRETVCTL
jgi:hypothetical protein